MPEETTEPFVPFEFPQEGAQLIRVVDPRGSDAQSMFYVTYELFGLTFIYEIGTGAEFRELFGGGGSGAFGLFESYQRMSQNQFNQIQGIQAGSIDEIEGTESLRSRFEARLRDFGLEDIPDWIRQNGEAMMVLATAAEEEWSTGRAWRELSKTNAFKRRFHGGAMEAIQRLTGAATIQETVAEYYEREAAVTSLLHTYRGENANVNPWYVGRVMAHGWDIPQMEHVLNAERILKTRPKALNRLNALLRYNGMEPVTFNGFLDIMRGNASHEVFEVINDAFRREALREAGVNIGNALATGLGSGSSLEVLSPEAFTEQARIAALELIANRRDMGKYGLTKPKVIQAAFGEGDASTEAILAKLYRERGLAAEGFDQVQAFIDQEDDLRIQGFSGL